MLTLHQTTRKQSSLWQKTLPITQSFSVTESQIENHGNFKLKIMGILYFCRVIKDKDYVLSETH